MTDTELKELIEDCCNEIANKIEPLANVKARLYASLKPAINYTRCCEELKDKPKLNFGDWKFSQGLRYMSDFTYKNAKGELFDADVVNNTYNDYYNL